MTQMNVEELVKLTEISQRITKMVNSMEFDWERLKYDMWSCCRGQEEFFDYIEYCKGEFVVRFSNGEDTWREYFDLREYMWLGGLR